MKLVIVESPTKAKTLQRILGEGYDFKASMGHIRDLPKSGLGVDVKHDFEPEYIVPDKSQKVLKDIKKSASKASTVFLATDPDREGEAIAWHLELLLSHLKHKPEFKRVAFHELTKDAVEEAFEHPEHVKKHLVDAQQARRVLDRLVGYKLSPLLWKTVRFGLSAGRVQSVAVRLIVEREREREAFKPAEYWEIKGEFASPHEKFVADLVKKNGRDLKINDEKRAKEIESELKRDEFQITEIEKSERVKNPYPPLRTSTLQQGASNVFGFTAKRTMQIAQHLFEKGYITYHRTDSLSLASKFIGMARDYVGKEFGSKYLPKDGIQYKTTSKNAQEAHEAIRPTHASRTPNESGLKGDEKKIYSLIWKRAIESQLLPAIYDQTTVLVESKKEKYLFRAVGSVIKFEGWLVVGNGNGENLVQLPNLKEGETLDLNKIDSSQHFTQPPARYSDATLIKKLEEMGIGRPSTYAPTISTIQGRGYVIRDQKYFVPTDFAYVVTDLLVDNFANIVDYDFTAKMEDKLDDIALGELSWVPVIREFYKPFEKNLEEKSKKLNKRDIITLEKTKEKCPECGSPMVVKLGRYGKFLSCSNYPKCDYAEPTDENKVLDKKGNEIEDFGKCPNCENGHFILKQGRFGRFLACSNYPKCKTTKPFLEKIDISCPKCKEGDIIIKKAKGRAFFGCSKYPDCDWSSWKDPRNFPEVLKPENWKKPKKK